MTKEMHVNARKLFLLRSGTVCG